MAISTPNKLYALSLSLGLLGMIGFGALDRARTPFWGELLDRTDDSHLVLVVNPANCKLNGREIRDINRFASHSGMRVLAVMTHPPKVDSVRAAIEQEFGFEVPVEWDEHSQWSDVLTKLAFGQSGIAMVVRQGRPQAIVAAEDWRMLTGQYDES